MYLFYLNCVYYYFHVFIIFELMDLLFLNSCIYYFYPHAHVSRVIGIAKQAPHYLQSRFRMISESAVPLSM